MQTLRLFIGGLPADIDQQWIQTRFQAISIDIPAPKYQSDPRKFAYVQVPSNQVPLLIKKFHNSRFRGNQLRVEIAKPSYLDRISNSNLEPVEHELEKTEPEINVHDRALLKIRSGRKRAREQLIHDTNSRHIKFTDNPDLCKKTTTEKSCKSPTQKRGYEPTNDVSVGESLPASIMPNIKEFCWGSVGEISTNNASAKSSNLAQISFLLSEKQSSECLIENIPNILQKEDTPRQSSGSKDSDSDSSNDSEEDQPIESTGNGNADDDASSNEVEDSIDDLIKTDDEGCSSSRRSDIVESDQNNCNDNMVLEEIRESNQSMMSVFKSMFGIKDDLKPKQDVMVWNHERRYDPNNQESVKKLSNEVIIDDDAKVDKIELADNKVELASQWTSLWSRNDSSKILAQGASFSLSQLDKDSDRSSVEHQLQNAVGELVDKDAIIVLERLRPSFLERFALRYKESGECFLFRRTSSTAELIAACKDAKHKRVHAYKRQIKDHRQVEQTRRTRS